VNDQQIRRLLEILENAVHEAQDVFTPDPAATDPAGEKLTDPQQWARLLAALRRGARLQPHTGTGEPRGHRQRLRRPPAVLGRSTARAPTGSRAKEASAS
jgi:hypothetical protein